MKPTTFIRPVVVRLSVLFVCLFVGSGVLAQSGEATQPRTVVPRGPLSAEEQRNIEIFQRVSPAVVTVVNKGLVSSFFDREVYEVEQGAGSGFMWNEEGYIVSNYHVIHKARAIEVILKDNTRLDAELVGIDADHDIAVLKVKLGDRKVDPIPLGTSRDLQVGQQVLAIGNPFGLSSSLSIGIVSSLGRSMRSMTGITIDDVIQTDAAINPGNSGGPLLDSAGRLIGMNTSIVTPSGGSVGIGFAVPVDQLNRMVPELIEFGKVRRATLGVSLLDDGRARYLGFRGAVIRRVFRGSPAAKAGLKGLSQKGRNLYVGDVIVGIDEFAVNTVAQLRDQLANYRPEDEIEVHILRGSKRLTTTLTLGALD